MSREENEPDGYSTPENDGEWSRFLDDSVKIVGADDKLIAAAADLLENPYDQVNRSQMIGLLTSQEFEDVSEAVKRVCRPQGEEPQP